MGKLDGKVALVTGGSEGIGLATAERFIKEGASHVYITGRRQEALDKAVKQIGGKNVTGVQADASKLADIDKLIDIIKQGHSRVDVLFANAGSGGQLKLGSITEEHYKKTFDLNVKGVLFTVQKLLPIFNDGGSIILVGSIAGSKGKEGMSVYSATKAAVRSFARTWSVDLKERKIRVNTLSPGPINTPLLNSLGEDEEALKKFLAKEKAETVLDRIGEPSEIASVAVFLASDDSSYVTGIELFVDGGAAQI